MLRRIVEPVLDLLAPPRCPGCDYVHAPGGFCGGCEPLLDLAPWAGVDRAAFEYHGPLADALQRLKYRARYDLARPIAAAMLEAIAFVGTHDVLIPVPLHASRLRQRGYNQSALLASAMAGPLGVPLRHGLLRRVRSTTSQVGLSRSERADNLRGAMRATSSLRGVRCLVVDDVRTSGATLDEARRALLEAGADEVQALVVAQAQPEGTNSV